MAKLRYLIALSIALSLGSWLVGGGALVAQDEPSKRQESPKGSQETEDSKADLDRRAIKILWLRNPATGELVPVPGMTIDEYDKLDRIRRGLPPELSKPPNFVIVSINLVGKVKGGQAHVACEMEVELGDDQWARIVLGMPRAVLQNAPLEQDWLVTADDASDGFVLWARGEKGEKKTLKLEFDYPLTTNASSSRLLLPLPRARSSVAKITVEGAEVTPKMDASGVIDSSRFQEGNTQVQCQFTSTLDLSWGPKAKLTDAAAWMEAAGAVEMRVTGRRQVIADAKLRIRSFGELAQPLKIRLPKGMRLSPEAVQISPYVLSQSFSQISSNPSDGQPQLLELSIDPAAPSEFELRIQTENESPVTPEATSWALDGFEVVGAKRHWGIVDLLLSPDWYVAASQDPSIHRIEIEPGTATDSSFLRSRFEYATQPARIQIAARLPRTLVEPSYDLFIESGQARLEGVLKYRFRGPSAGRVEIDLGDWAIERLTSPDASFLVDDLEQAGGRLTVPLSPQALPVSAESILRFEARQAIGGSEAKLRLPLANASIETPAIVRVLSDINVEITPRSSEFKGVSIDSSTGASANPPQRGQLTYRTRPGGEAPILAFDLQVKKQSLVVEPVTQLILQSKQNVTVQHQFHFQVAYEPLREFEVELPLPQESVDVAQVVVDDQPLELIESQEKEPTENGPTWTYCRYALPKALLGPLKINIQYPIAVPQAVSRTAGFHLPRLAAKSLPQWKPHRLTIRGSELSLIVDPEIWARDYEFNAISASRSEDHYVSYKPQTTIFAKINGGVASTPMGNRLQRWWLQSSLADSARADRLCIQLGTWNDPVRLKLPAGVISSSITVAVDASVRESRLQIMENGELVIEPPREDRSKLHLIEIWYQCETSAFHWGHYSLAAPEVSGAHIFDRLYWQILTPANWYSLARPRGWIAEMPDGWSAWSWKSTGALDQADLERWVGASMQRPPPKEINQYLFSTSTKAGHLSLWLAPRRELWLGGLGLVFLTVTSLIYLPALRSSLFILSLAAAVGSAVAIEPSWGVGLAQFLLIGTTIAAMVGLLRRWIAPSPRFVSPRSAPSRSGARVNETAALGGEEAASSRRGSSIKPSSIVLGRAP